MSNYCFVSIFAFVLGSYVSSGIKDKELQCYSCYHSSTRPDPDCVNVNWRRTETQTFVVAGGDHLGCLYVKIREKDGSYIIRRNEATYNEYITNNFTTCEYLRSRHKEVVECEICTGKDLCNSWPGDPPTPTMFPVPEIKCYNCKHTSSKPDPNCVNVNSKTSFKSFPTMPVDDDNIKPGGAQFYDAVCIYLKTPQPDGSFNIERKVQYYFHDRKYVDDFQGCISYRLSHKRSQCEYCKKDLCNTWSGGPPITYPPTKSPTKSPSTESESSTPTMSNSTTNASTITTLSPPNTSVHTKPITLSVNLTGAVELTNMSSSPTTSLSQMKQISISVNLTAVLELTNTSSPPNTSLPSMKPITISVNLTGVLELTNASSPSNTSLPQMNLIQISTNLTGELEFTNTSPRNTSLPQMKPIAISTTLTGVLGLTNTSSPLNTTLPLMKPITISSNLTGALELELEIESTLTLLPPLEPLPKMKPIGISINLAGMSKLIYNERKQVVDIHRKLGY